MVGCSTYLRDEVGDILDVSAPAGDFMLTPSAPRFPWIAPGPASRPSCARRAQCADPATATSDGGPRRTRTAQDHALRQMGIGSTTSTPTSGISMWIPTTPCSRQGHMDRAEGAPAHRIRRKMFGADLPGRQGRLSRSPQSLERIERFYDGRQAEPLLLNPGLHSAPLSRSLTLRQRARLTGRRRPHQRLLQLGAIWAPSRAPPLVHSTR
jgi:hypothetical protein